MEKFFAYLLSVNLLLVLQVVYYRLLLARQRRFQWNRAYLLGGMVAALVLPLLHWEVVPPSLPDPSFIRTLPAIVIHPSQPVASPASTWTIWDVGVVLYGTGVAFFLGSLLIRNLAIVRLILSGQRIHHQGYTLVMGADDIGPASYFRFIFWNERCELDSQSAAVAMAHERCHSRELHSLDLLGVELMKTFCWFNPAAYLLRKDLRETHEYLADQAALQVAGLDGIKRLLLMRQFGARHLSIANHFYSPIKARIQMLTETTKRKALVQYLLIVPLAGLMVACTSFGHPVDERAAYVVADSPKVHTAGYTPMYYDLNDVLFQAEWAAKPRNTEPQGLVCLGAEPPVLSLDGDYKNLATKELPEDYPQILNHAKVSQMIGYPKEAEERKITGKVVVKALVSEEGRVIRYLILQEDYAPFREAVVAHIEDLRFRPGMKEGKVVKWWVVVPFLFGMSAEGC